MSEVHSTKSFNGKPKEPAPSARGRVAVRRLLNGMAVKRLDGHVPAGETRVDAVVRAREPRATIGTNHTAHRPDAVLLWSADEPDHAEPASAASMERKIDALLCHASQATTTMDDATSSDERREAFAGRIESWMEGQGAAFGHSHAEVFKRLTP